MDADKSKNKKWSYEEFYQKNQKATEARKKIVSARLKRLNTRYEQKITCNDKVEYPKQASTIIKNETRKAYYEKNKDKIKEYERKRAGENKEQTASNKKAYYIRNKEKIEEYRRKWREENNKKLRAAHKEKMIKYFESSKP